MQNATVSAQTRLVELMSWLELGDGVRYLSELIRMPLSRDDLLRLALEGHVTLSVRLLSPVAVQRGRAVPFTEDLIEQVPMLDGEGTFVMVRGTVLPDREQVVVFEDEIATISDVWDLPMIGGEQLMVEDIYEALQSREAPELINLEGAFVSDSQGIYCKLMERFGPEHRDPARKPYDPRNFFPAAALPKDAVVVTRPSHLREFAAKFAEQEVKPSQPAAPVKPLGNRERTTLLTVLAAVSRMAKMDVTRVSAAAAAIEAETARMGARVAARTIEEHLKRIPDALESRAA